MKYVLVSGGVVSGLGKGVTSSSIGLLLREAGLRVTSMKIDPYINIDAGTMSPFEHGECYVLEDGGEADLDLGNYERFLGVTLTRDHNITTGKVYQEVIRAERKGEYLGKTVQVVPHVTDAVQQWIERVAAIPVDGSGRRPDVCLIELGGTVGDIESMVFLEALRQLRFRVGGDNMCHVHVSLVPVVGAVGEPKSKPTQHGVKELRSVGLHPDIIVCRSSAKLDRSIIGKISLFSMVPATHVVGVHDVSNLYRVPLLLLEQRVPSLVLGCLRLNRMPPDGLPAWRRIADRMDAVERTVTVALVGKYTGLSDSYLSVTKALLHAGIACEVRVRVSWVDSSMLEDECKAGRHAEAHEAAWEAIRAADGVLIPGGFGNRGTEGKILAARYARENRRPFLGICLGMQVAVVEFARHVAGIPDATSAEVNPEAAEPVVVFMPEISQTHMGGSMRLGLRSSAVKASTLAHQLYGYAEEVHERHRHRYEVNPDYVERIEQAGLVFSATDGVRMEIVELPAETHPFFVAPQFHPEFTSRPLSPNPLFLGFVQACAGTFERAPRSTFRSGGTPQTSPKSKGSAHE